LAGSPATIRQLKETAVKAPRGDAYWTWYEKVWDERETTVLPMLLDGLEEGIFTLEQTEFLQGWLTSPQAQADGIHPSWQSFGVLLSSPGAPRKHWAYVTSGLTNPLTVEPGQELDPTSPSGFGYEMVVFTPQEEQWPIVRLLSMMAYNLVCLQPFTEGDRWPVGGPLDGGDSELDAFVFATPREITPVFQLESGAARLMAAVGVTAAEFTFAEKHGTDALMERLYAAGVGCLTDPGRGEVDLT